MFSLRYEIRRKVMFNFKLSFIITSSLTYVVPYTKYREIILTLMATGNILVTSSYYLCEVISYLCEAILHLCEVILYLCEVILYLCEVSYGEVLGDKSAMYSYIRATLY